jgi:outer membrane biosynthesis protein TonB
LRDLATRVLKPGDEKLVLFPGELEFSIVELGLVAKNGKFVKDKVAPPALAWAINSGKLLTDMGEYAFKDGFIYAEGITVEQSETPVTVSTEPISKPTPKQEKTQIRETKPESVEEIKPVEQKQEVKEQPKVKPTSENRQSRRAKAQELARSLKQPDANAPKVSRYMTAEEANAYAESLG